MNFSKPSVSRAVRLLKQGGYITVDQEGHLHLTKLGTEIAAKIYERHTLLAELLVRLASLYQFPGTIKIMPDTYYRVMEDIIDSLAHWGFKNFMFINMHAGNVPIISQLAREKQRQYGIKCNQVDWWRFIQPNSTDICENKGWRAHGHASESGTSVMLHLHPEYVEMDKLYNVEQDPSLYKWPDFPVLPAGKTGRPPYEPGPIPSRSGCGPRPTATDSKA